MPAHPLARGNALTSRVAASARRVVTCPAVAMNRPTFRWKRVR